jgi:hypothetical protein
MTEKEHYEVYPRVEEDDIRMPNVLGGNIQHIDASVPLLWPRQPIVIPGLVIIISNYTFYV